MNVIDNAKKGAVIDSAYGYKDAVYKGFLEELSNNPSFELPTGNFSLVNENTLNSDDKVINVNVTGTIPDIGSWIELRRGEVVAFSLKIGDYIVTKYENESIKATKGTEVADNPALRDLNNAIKKAKELISNINITGKNNEIVEIENGWIVLLNNKIISYSVKVEENNKNYVVTFEDKILNGTEDDTYTAVIGTALTSTDIVTTIKKVTSNYLVKVSSDSIVQSYTEEKVLNASDITSVTKPTEIDDNSWIRFAYNSTSNPKVTISDYSVKVEDYIVDYSSTETDYMTVTKGGTLRDKPLIIGSAVTNFGGYDWHVIGITDDAITLLMDVGANGSNKLPGITDGKLAHCPEETSYCSRSGSDDAFTYSWDKSKIKEYLNSESEGSFLSNLKSEIGNIIIPVTVCNDPSNYYPPGGTPTYQYGGYLVSEIPTGESCTSSSDYNVRLITNNESRNISSKNYSWYSNSLGSWWGMGSVAFSMASNANTAAVKLSGSSNQMGYAASYYIVRPVIKISK